MEFGESKKHIERAADVIFRAAKLTQKKLPSPERVASAFEENLNNFQNSKKVNELFNKNAKAILDKIQENKRTSRR